MTPLVIFFAQYRDDDSNVPGRDPALSVVSLLPLIYVVLAAGVALTKHRYVTWTSTPIRHVSRLMSTTDLIFEAGTLAICLFFGVHRMRRIICAAAASRHPGFDELASRPPRGCAHIVVGTIERLGGQFRSKRACRRRRHALI